MRARQLVLPTPPKSSHPTQLLSRQHFARVSPLAATLMDLLTSVANKRLTAGLTPLAATLTKNRGWGPALRASDKDAHPESANGGGADSRFRPCRKGFFSGFTLLYSSAPRVFHNSFTTKRFRTLSQNCRGVTLQLPLFAGHNAESHSFRPFLSTAYALFQVSYPVSPLRATVTKTAGVYQPILIWFTRAVAAKGTQCSRRGRGEVGTTSRWS